MIKKKINKVKGGHKLKGYKHHKPFKDENMVLVGFGKYELDEVLKWFGTSREIEALKAPILFPPRWRRESLCSDKEKSDFVKYTSIVQKVNFTDYITL